ncbi:MAG: butyrate kinase [Hornefia sp.]|nr:butyrate kinase [Hornefia sp.]
MKIGEIREILVINPGSTSTKIAVYKMDERDEDLKVLFEENIVHNEDEVLAFDTIADQKDYRQKTVLNWLSNKGYELSGLTAVVGRGGMLNELKGGGYMINDTLYKKMQSPRLPQHASSLGALLAYAIAKPLGIPSFIYDSTMGAELLDVAKITGVAGLEKQSATHLLNSRAQDIKYAKSLGKDYREMNFINCHMGGGITVNAMHGGKVIDVYSYDDGPMAPERTGGIPLLLFKRMCFNEEYTESDIERVIAGKGGLYSHLGTKDAREVEARVDAGEPYATLVYEAMGFQAAKAIAGLSCALLGNVDAVILTGGIARSKWLTDKIEKYCGHIGKVVVMPGESEMEALAEGTKRMLLGEEEYRTL